MDLRVVKDAYSRQRVRTVWCGSYSDTFECTNGIRQGAVASPHLFCIVMDQLLSRLEKEKHGCWFGPYYCGVLCYADDIVLLSPSLSGLKEMLSTCHKFSVEYGMTFNPKESVGIRFGRKPEVDLPKLRIGQEEIEWRLHINHLGNQLQFNLAEDLDVAQKRGDLFGRVNTMLATLPGAPKDLLLRVFGTKCCHFYGVQSWNYSDRCTNNIFIAWNRCARRLLGLHPATHTRYVTALVGWNARTRIMRSTLALIRKICHHKESWIRYVGKYCSDDLNTIIGGNKSFVEKALCDAKRLSPEDEACLLAITELRETHDSKMTIANLTTDELLNLINFLCIS